MSDWFFMLGEPISESERRQIHEYLSGLRLEELPIEIVTDWQSAAHTLANPEWDQRWWDAEQTEKNRLQAQTRSKLGETELMRQWSLSLESAEAIHGAAAVEAARHGCADSALIRVAAGAASQALHLAALARLAEAKPDHPFLIKQALFAGGHWPLGIVNGRYWIF